MREGAKKAVDDTRHTFTTGLTIDWIMMPNAYDFLDEHINEKGELVMKIKLPFVKKEHIKELLAIDGVTGFYAKTQQVEAYTGLTVKPGHHAWLLDFLDGKYSEEYLIGDKVDIIGLLEINSFNGTDSVQINMKDIRKSY